MVDEATKHCRRSKKKKSYSERVSKDGTAIESGKKAAKSASRRKIKVSDKLRLSKKRPLKISGKSKVLNVMDMVTKQDYVQIRRILEIKDKKILISTKDNAICSWIV